jgi:type II secretory pathway pseudopilin PulG
MKVHNVLTFIVTHNYGRPHTLSLPAWKVYAGAAGAAAALAVLTVLSLAFLATFPRWRDAEHSVRQLRLERDALREQILAINQDALEVKEKRLVVQAGDDEGTDDPGGAPAAAGVPERYTEPLRITSLAAKVNQSALEVSFLLISQDRGRGNRGGYLFTVLENQDQKPPLYQTGPGVQVNDAGFPEAYKEGLIFPHVAHTLAFRRKIKLDAPGAVFTHVTVYLFSPRGGLIAKERFPLERALFQPSGAPVLAGISRSS